MSYTRRYQGPIDPYQGEGCFGSIARYFCNNCNSPIWSKPDSYCSQKGCGFESFYGPEETLYDWVCPFCGAGEDVNETNLHGYVRHFKPLARKCLSLPHPLPALI